MSGVEAEWDKDNGKYKLYTEYKREIAGDDIGVFIDFDTQQNEEVEVLMGVSFVSMENARLNAEKELAQTTFDSLRTRAEEAWNNDLSKILVEGGSEDQKTVFYTALYCIGFNWR